jgi:hypothetical protein
VEADLPQSVGHVGLFQLPAQSTGHGDVAAQVLGRGEDGHALPPCLGLVVVIQVSFTVEADLPQSVGHVGLFQLPAQFTLSFFPPQRRRERSTMEPVGTLYTLSSNCLPANIKR